MRTAHRTLIVLFALLLFASVGMLRADAQSAQSVLWQQECLGTVSVSSTRLVSCVADQAPTATETPTPTPRASTSPTATATAGPPSGSATVLRAGTDFAQVARNAPAGSIIYLRAGIYDVGTGGHYGVQLRDVTLASYPGERATIRGLVAFSLQNAVVRDLLFVWGGGSSGAHMVKLNSGTNWRFENNEVMGAQSYACVLVTGSPENWVLRGNRIHDCVGGNGDPNQNHGVYVNAPGSVNGLLDGNTIEHIPMGRGLKLGPSSTGAQGARNLTVRNNTINDTRRSSISLSGENISNVLITGNTLTNSAESAIRLYEASGGGVRIEGTRWSGSPVFCADGSSSLKCSSVVGGGNTP